MTDIEFIRNELCWQKNLIGLEQNENIDSAEEGFDLKNAKRYESILKKLKFVEIAKKYCLNLDDIREYDTYEEYLDCWVDCIPYDDWKLCKEVLEDE